MITVTRFKSRSAPAPLGDDMIGFVVALRWLPENILVDRDDLPEQAVVAHIKRNVDGLKKTVVGRESPESTVLGVGSVVVTLVESLEYAPRVLGEGRQPDTVHVQVAATYLSGGAGYATAWRIALALDRLFDLTEVHNVALPGDVTSFPVTV